MSAFLVQLSNQGGSLFGFLVLAAAEDARGSRQQGLLLGPDLTGMGFVPLSPTGAGLLFEVLSQRYERGPTLWTINLPVDEWAEVFRNDDGTLHVGGGAQVHLRELGIDRFFNVRFFGRRKRISQ